ncbi:MAG: 3-hydroxyacyl-ACP dehydratase FabZ [Hyphomicrobiales bacterium]|nr:3-hydroxyacyl-ACP dehydratase FabZ [Hyphomicrobiales bacterium]
MSDTPNTTLDAVDIMRLLELIPHRYPFLMVDRIVDVDGDDSGIGIKNVSINEPHFQGHFPESPVMPGVLLVEGMAQTAGAMCVLANSEIGQPKIVYFMTIDNVKFRKPVVPGDQVKYHMRKHKKRRNIWWFHGEAKVDGVLVAEADVSAMLIASEG